MIKPDYERGGIKLYLKDSSRFQIEGDAVITDPPYGRKTKTNYAARKREGLAPCNDFPLIEGDDKPFDPSPWLKYPIVALFGANWYADRLPISGAWIVWDKVDGLKSKRKVGFNDNSDCELIWTNKGQAARIISHRWMGCMKASEHGQRRVHPTQKPVWLMERLVKYLTDPGDLIIDPYMGSCPLGVACVRTGRRYVGFEIVEAYFKVAVSRVDRELI